LALKEYDIWELVDKVVVPPINLLALAAHEKKEIKDERVILDSMKDNIIPHLYEKKTTKDMFHVQVGLFQRTNMNRKMVLINKIRSVQMSRYDNDANYFMRITQIHDKLAAIGDKLDDVDLVSVALNGFLKYWEPFVKGICA